MLLDAVSILPRNALSQIGSNQNWFMGIADVESSRMNNRKISQLFAVDNLCHVARNNVIMLREMSAYAPCLEFSF